MTILLFICCLGAFAIGGVPFGYLVGRLVLKDDIRRHGSGNIGATNVARIIGWKWGGLVLVLDAIKGFVPTLTTGLLVQSQHPGQELPAEIAAGVCTIVGHMYPVWLRLRGGKGVATALGVILVIAPVASAAAVAAFALVAGVSRVIALASVISVVTFGVVELTLLGGKALAWPDCLLAVFAIMVPGLIIWRHRSNIARLWRGEERAITENPSAAGREPNGTHFESSGVRKPDA